MDALRVFETLKNPTEELDQNTIGLSFEPSVMQISLMHEEYIRTDYDKASVFVDLLVKDDKWYLLIYLWEPYNYTINKPYKCFYCTRGYRLNEEEERELVYYCTDENTCTSKLMVQEIVRQVQILAPDMNLYFNSDKPLYSVLHIYFCMFRGVRELLFKARLQYLAASIDRIESYDMLPVLTNGSPVDLFEKKRFTMRLLRMLDNEWGICDLLDEESRQVAAGTYKRFSQILGGYNQITCSQWQYLKACHKGKFRFQKKIFHLFRRGETEVLYEDYVIFDAKYKIINRYIHWPRSVSSIPDLEKFMNEADYTLLYVTDREKWDQMIREQNNRLMYLDYSDGNYIVTHPTTIAEIFQEGISQNNCLLSMFEEIAQGDRDIGYMRFADKPEQSLITFEVCNGKVCQLLKKNNEMLQYDSLEFQWFTNIYLKEKKLILSEYLMKCYKAENLVFTDNPTDRVEEV